MADQVIQSGLLEILYNTDSVDHMLDAMIAATSPYSLELFLRTDVSEWFEKDIESRFNEEGDVKSGFWQPLSEATEHIREELGYGASEPINRRTDALFDFVMTGREYIQGGEFAEMQVPGSPPDPLTARKLETAQRGSTSSNPMGFGPTPARPVLAVSEMDLVTIMEMLVLHIDTYLSTGGFDGVFQAA